MDLGLDGRVALVTAGSKGLGLASARALAGDGARVLLASRSPESLEQARHSVVASGGGECEVAEADLNDPEAPARLGEEAVGRWGRLDVVVANNGGPPPGPALAVDDAAIEAAVNANLLASVRLVRAAAPHMAAGGWGRICCITSYSVVLPMPSLSLSNVARTALYAWVRTACRELLPQGITINLACPGAHATERMKQLGGGGGGPMGDPEDFGKAVAFLCSQAAGFITGTTLVVDGGATAAQP
jgi:3-oxoacyl-[acyl-carrier protein] reductase